jgi:hypothetical protein
MDPEVIDILDKALEEDDCEVRLFPFPFVPKRIDSPLGNELR